MNEPYLNTQNLNIPRKPHLNVSQHLWHPLASKIILNKFYLHKFKILHRKYSELKTMFFFIFRCPEPKMWFKKSWPFVSYGLNSSRTITKPIKFTILKIFCHEYCFGRNRCMIDYSGNVWKSTPHFGQTSQNLPRVSWVCQLPDRGPIIFLSSLVSILL